MPLPIGRDVITGPDDSLRTQMIYAYDLLRTAMGGSGGGLYNSPFNYGAVADGAHPAEDTAAWQACIDDTDDGDGIFTGPASSNYSINSSLLISARKGLNIFGPGQPINGFPRLTWVGSSGGELIKIYDSYACLLNGLALYSGSGSSTVNKFIDIDTVGGFSSNHRLYNLLLNASNQTNSSFKGISVNESASANNENMEIVNLLCYGSSQYAALVADDGVMTAGSPNLDTSSYSWPTSGLVGKTIRVGKAGTGGATLIATCLSRTSATRIVLSANAVANVTGARIHVGTGYGTGIWTGNNQNVKHNILRNVQITQCEYGIYQGTGSIEVYNYGAGFNNYGFWSNDNTEPIIIEQMVTEGNLVEIHAVGSSAPVHIREGRGSNSWQLTEGFYELTGQVTFSNCNLIENQVPLGGKVFRFLGINALYLTLENCRFQAANPRPTSIEETGFDTLMPNQFVFTKGWTKLASFPFQTQFGSDDSGAKYSLAAGRLNPRDVLVIAGKDWAGDTNNMGTSYPVGNSLYLGQAIEIAGLYPPAYTSADVIGTPGSTTYHFKLIARDSIGNRVMQLSDVGLFARVTNGNATLNSTNYIRISWPSQWPAPTDYVLLDLNPSNPGEARVVATITPTATQIQVYNVQTNPSGSYLTTLYPSKNETAKVKFRGKVCYPNELTFGANDATPSVGVGGVNDFVTANSSATSITTFDDFEAGQPIRVRVNDAFTTLVHGSGLMLKSAANIVPANTQNRIFTFIRRGSDWYECAG